MIYCSKCKTKKGNFIKYAKNRQGIQYYHCSKCNSKRLRDYRKTKRGKEVFSKIRERQAKKFPRKTRAREKLNLAVKLGNIIRPNKCTNCKKSGKIDAHHQNYNNPLVVIWVCKRCHFDIYH